MFEWMTLLLAYLWLMGGLHCVKACEVHVGFRLTPLGKVLGVLLWPVLSLVSIATFMVRELTSAWTGAAREAEANGRHAA